MEVTIELFPVCRFEITAKDLGPGPGVMYMMLDPSGERRGSLTAGLAPNAAASSANV